MSISYPVSRLLAQPKLFFAIANYMEGPDAETIRSSFYELLEAEIDQYDSEDCEFAAQEAIFESFEGGLTYTIQLDTGTMCKLEATEGEMKAQIKSDKELAATSAIYQRLVMAIEETCPELAGDIALCSPPTPSNNFLSSLDGDSFEGSFHLKSNPDSQFSFTVHVIDPEEDQMEATVEPM